MYKLVKNKLPNGVIETTLQVERLVDGALIPFDEGNADYRMYLVWLAEGNTPKEWTPE